MDIEKNGLPRSKRALKELREEARRALILPSEGQDKRLLLKKMHLRKSRIIEENHRLLNTSPPLYSKRISVSPKERTGFIGRLLKDCT